MTQLTNKNFPKLTTNKTETLNRLKRTYRQFLTPLEETRLIIEDIVIPKNLIVDLSPQTTKVRKEQYDLIAHYQLKVSRLVMRNNVNYVFTLIHS